MYIYIEIEDLVANAFIDLVEKKNKREILFSELDEYGAKVIEALNSDGNTNAVLVVSRESQIAMIEDYSDMRRRYSLSHRQRGGTPDTVGRGHQERGCAGDNERIA